MILIYWLGDLQVISLIASYLHVPLRYPLRLGGSHSYIKDCAVFNNPTSSGSNSTSLAAANKKCLEFPLFLDGQDATRAAYAIFLLNKVCCFTHLSLFHIYCLTTSSTLWTLYINGVAAFFQLFLLYMELRH